MCSLNMGSMNFAIFGMADRYANWKFDWEEPYLRRTDDHIFRNTFRDIARIIDALGVTFDLAPDNARAVEIAVELERHSAYDAAYLALAERLDAEVWTLDGPLFRNAGSRHAVKLIG